jgi:transposase
LARPAHAPTKLTQVVLDKIVEGVKLGVPMVYATKRAGVTLRTVRNWLRDAREGSNGLKAELLRGVEEAQGEFVAANMRVIDDAAKAKTWQAAAWLLERLHNEHFSAHRAEVVQLRREVARLLKLVGEKYGSGQDPAPVTEDRPAAPSEGSPPGGLLP